jgi:hypothetical protein
MVVTLHKSKLRILYIILLFIKSYTAYNICAPFWRVEKKYSLLRLRDFNVPISSVIHLELGIQYIETSVQEKSNIQVSPDTYLV